jgi:hypothetical protein
VLCLRGFLKSHILPLRISSMSDRVVLEVKNIYNNLNLE